MTKAQLRAYRDIKRERDRLDAMIANLEGIIYGPRSPQITGMPHGGGGPGTPTEDAAIRHADLVNRYEAKVAELTKALVEIESAIECLDPRERTLIRLYYIEGLTWEEVCVSMHYEWAQIHRIHALALRKLKDA
jgi:RNA polymerase sigma factor (sigma-70 family)